MEIRGDSQTAKADIKETNNLLQQSQLGSAQEEPAKQQEKTYSKEQVDKEIENLNKWLEIKKTHLKFIKHEKLDKYYVQVINDGTGEVIREVPSKKIMDMVASFYENIGLIVDEKR
ncbi:flagellar protein FlaG [Brevibacillus fulvus]|uniref:Flagellar protein FlaG n=1 Tax=Brevibacillus fulvus TaxID=1125967 RepID=A0A938Y4L1_9BACL|nr:flagellar protein FlaG [Brevibacillus fulvus]